MWRRRLRVTFSGGGGSLVVNEEAYLTVTASRTIGSKPNTGTISIMNLSRSSRNEIGKELDTVKVEAGYYDGDFGLVFEGQIRDTVSKKSGDDGEKAKGGVSISRDGADIETTIELGDGDKGLRNSAGSKVWKKGTKPEAIVKDIAAMLEGVKMGQVKGLDKHKAIERDWVMFGAANEELDTLGRQFNFYWSIQNGTFEAVDLSEGFDEFTVISGAGGTGVIGIPEVTDNGVNFTHLPIPQLAPNRKIKIKSPFIDELNARKGEGGESYRITKVDLDLSSQDVNFYAKVQAEKLPAKDEDGDDSEDNEG